MKWIFGFEESAATRVDIAGGKGSSLSKMAQAGFPVPPGLVVSSTAYRDWIKDDWTLAGLISKLNFTEADVLRSQCSAIRTHMQTRPLPTALVGELQARLGDLLARGPVAVRSSSTMEDLVGAAFAGQHDTYLNMGSEFAVIDGIRRCFASLWEDRAVMYRHKRGFDHVRAAMAVVIQSMVRSDVAGVAFTMNPIDGNLDQVVVNAAWGLGETVVSGEGDVDQFTLKKADGSIVVRTIAEKLKAIVGTKDGTAQVDVEPKKRNMPSLSDLELISLAALCRKIEDSSGFPQDIEWAFSNGALYLLQSRPITKFPAKWTRQESAERFPNPITPLTWDFVKEGFHASLEYSLQLMGQPAFEGVWFDRFDDYIYGNETAVRLFTTWKQVDFASLDQLRLLKPEFRERYAWVLQLPVIWARDLDRYLIKLGALATIDLKKLNTEELWKHLNRVNKAGTDYFLPNIAISISQGILHRTLFRLVAFVVGREKAQELYDGLTCFCETKTNLVNQELREMADLVRGEPKLLSLFESCDRRKIWMEQRLESFPQFQERFLRFLGDHGHREVDFDSYVPTWIGQPWIVLENVALLSKRELGENPIEREIELRSRQETSERKFLDAVPEDLRYFASELVRLARTYTALDDLEHYQTTRLSVPFRAAIVELGRRLIAANVANEPAEAFFLTRATLRGWVEGSIPTDTARNELRKNKDLFEAHRKSPPPWQWGVTEDTAPAAGALRGLPGSPGTAEGNVYIVHGPEDFADFPKGAVLVARTTNPAWTPLFPLACAVITESGGPLSHGAVTAREVGIPAVMALRGAMTRLTPKSRVRVNGSTGEVMILEKT